MKLFWAKQTAEDIERLTAELPHAILLTGPVGIGLQTLARQIASDHLSGVIEPTDARGNIDTTSAGVVRVVQIRDLLSHAINKTRSRRIYIIDEADRMNHQAQNAFLKLLEEPAPHVHFILLSHHSEKLLPTIHSRVQTLRVMPIDRQQSVALLDSHKVLDEKMRSQLLFIAEGLPAELTRLTSDSELFAKMSALIMDARRFLQGTTIEKLKVVNDYGSDRPRTLELLTFAERILRHSLSRQPNVQIVERADEISTTYDRIAANGYVRIQLLRLVV